MELIPQLKPLWPFSELDPCQLEELARHTRRRCYPSGDSLFHQGDPAHSLFLVVSGAVNLQRVLPDGVLCHLTRCVPLDLVEETSLPNGKPHSADAVTVGPCTLLIVDGAPFMRSLEHSARFSARFLEEILQRQSQRLQEQAVFQTMTVVGRVAVTLLELIEIYGAPESGGTRRLEVSVTQQELARWVGVQRESVNRTLSSLKRVGAIRFEGRHLVILNERRLREYGST